MVEKLATNLEIDPDPDPGSEPVSEEHGILPICSCECIACYSINIF